MKQIVIGIGGIATAGKDFFTTIAIECLRSYGLACSRYALADELKLEVAPFLMEQYGIDVFNCTAEEKELIRPFLIWHGTDMRRTRFPNYWIDKIQEKIDKDKNNVIFVTDVRYANCVIGNETTWVKSRGIQIFISRFVDDVELQPKPDNKNELYHTPELKRLSDYVFKWNTIYDSEGKPDIEQLKPLVCDFISNEIYGRHI